LRYTDLTPWSVFRIGIFSGISTLPTLPLVGNNKDSDLKTPLVGNTEAKIIKQSPILDTEQR